MYLRCKDNTFSSTYAKEYSQKYLHFSQKYCIFAHAFEKKSNTILEEDS